MDEFHGDLFLNNEGDGDNGLPRRTHRICEPKNDFEQLNEVQFKLRYRLSKRAFLVVLERIGFALLGLLHGNQRISPVVQLLVALRFYATGSYLLTVGDCINISKTSTWKIVHRVSPLIAALRAEFIRFPATMEELRQSQAEMFVRSGFPRVAACVDGRQVRIQSYGGEFAELYRNRHDYFSINIQGMCNARLQFVDFVARWPGSTHDSTIFQDSRINHDFQEGRFGDAILLGDAGYPDLPYLMTPLQNPETPQEHLYNEAQIRTRNCIERCFGVWSRRFAVVKIGSRFHTPERTLPVIVATAVLHNIALQVDLFDYPLVDVHAYERIHNDVQFGDGDTVRKQLINGYFQQLSMLVNLGYLSDIYALSMSGFRPHLYQIWMSFSGHMDVLLMSGGCPLLLGTVLEYAVNARTIVAQFPPFVSTLDTPSFIGSAMVLDS